MSLSALMVKPLSTKSVGWDTLLSVTITHLAGVRRAFKIWVEVFFHLCLLSSPCSNHLSSSSAHSALHYWGQILLLPSAQLISAQFQGKLRKPDSDRYCWHALRPDKHPVSV